MAQNFPARLTARRVFSLRRLIRGGNIAPSLPARDLQAGKRVTERVGYVDGSYKAPTHPNMRKHFQGVPVINRSMGVSKLESRRLPGADEERAEHQMMR
jgi:hypothetical protein